MKTALLIITAAMLVGCAKGPQPVAQNSNTGSNGARSDRPQTTIAHTTEGQPPSAPSANSTGTGGKWTQSGNPIDTGEFDSAVTAAENALKAKPSDAGAKAALVDAYFKRGFALTEARQYASALGDYRRALKIDPSHEESKKWQQQIIGIYEMMKKEYPKEGEEPPPLPFKKEA
jgi:hypothetical protein